MQDSLKDSLGFVFKVALTIMMVLAGLAALKEFAGWKLLYPKSPLWTSLWSGFLVYLISYVLFLRKRIEFFETLEHEFTHTIFHWFSGQKVVEMKVNTNGNGEVVAEGRNDLTLLAPYIFPTLLVPLLILKPVITTPYLPFLTGLAGAAFAYHLLSTIRELKTAQEDLKTVGYISAIPIIVSCFIITTGISVTFLLYGADGVISFSRGIFNHSQGIGQEAVTLVIKELKPFI